MLDHVVMFCFSMYNVRVVSVIWCAPYQQSAKFMMTIHRDYFINLPDLCYINKCTVVYFLNYNCLNIFILHLLHIEKYAYTSSVLHTVLREETAFNKQNQLPTPNAYLYNVSNVTSCYHNMLYCT